MAVAGPARPRGLAVCGDFRAGPQQLLAAGVGADEAGGAVEVGRLGRGAEDVGEEKVGHAGGCQDAHGDDDEVGALLRGAHHLLARRQVRPAHLAGIAGQRDGFPRRGWSWSWW